MAGSTTSRYSRSGSAARASSSLSSRNASDAGSVIPRPNAQHLGANVGRIRRHVARHFGARADQAHAAAQHIDELRQLVELAAAQDGAGAGDARVGADRDGAAWQRLRIRTHGAELVDAKEPAVAADALLPKQRRPWRIQAHPHGDGGEHGRKQRQAGRGDDDIEQPLQHAAAGRLARSGRSGRRIDAREHLGHGDRRVDGRDGERRGLAHVVQHPEAFGVDAKRLDAAQFRVDQHVLAQRR